MLSLCEDEGVIPLQGEIAKKFSGKFGGEKFEKCFGFRRGLSYD